MTNHVRPLVVGNWKMNLDFVEAVHLGQQIGVILKNRPAEHTDVVIAPPFVDLRSVASIIASERMLIALGAQHVNAQENGAHTGEVSLSMLRRLNVDWVLVGHSERRTNYSMSDELVKLTLRTVATSGMKAVLCVGEESGVREEGRHLDFVAEQLRHAIEGLDEKSRSAVTVAYEPLWAIGSGTSATVEQIAEMTSHVKAILRSESMAESRVLYGGSVTADNATSIITDGGVDGFLVGGASLKAESFVAIVHACNGCYAGKR